ncbi:MAG: hypothetical protein OEY67_05150 [Gammaproteobacteria bacterium]|nr:hypothetical protein [Gammaproteobacteria bacterium]
MKKVTTTVWTMVTVFLLAGCVGGKPHLENINELMPDEVILVGRIELVPPLEKVEQELNTIGSGRFQGKVHMLVSEQQFDLDKLPMSAGSHTLFVNFDQDFYIRQPRVKNLHYSGSVVLMESTQRFGGVDAAQMKLPGGLSYTIPANQKAVYIGTVRYYRDDYNAITKIRFVDDYKTANKSFIKKFGKKYKLVRAKVSQSKS